jgi:hypothetical protein
MDMKIGEEGRVVIHSQVKTRLSLYKDEEALLHTADRPVVWFQMHKITKELESRLNKENTKQHKLDPSSICD